MLVGHVFSSREQSFAMWFYNSVISSITVDTISYTSLLHYIATTSQIDATAAEVGEKLETLLAGEQNPFTSQDVLLEVVDVVV